MINTILGTKLDSLQKFTKDGKRIPVTRILTGPCPVIQVKTRQKDGYDAIQLGWGEKKLNKISKPLKGHIKGAKPKLAPRFLQEVKIKEESKFKVGDLVKVSDVLKPGDKVDVAGISKGKGFTGVMKRWGFAGGPATHGQSDRARAPGSIGQTTTPGRVFPGKKMAGRAGGAKVTIRNLTVMDVDEDKNLLLVKGLVPGSRNGLLVLKRVGEESRFIPLMEKGKKEIKELEEERKARLRKEERAEKKLEEIKKKEKTEKTKETKEEREGEKNAES